ncbi:unnamed protein product [Somion occarium]|uniref:Uncharacterized protein n=1 Tax=Somion occarium TaxID=3059160 RepID=A0ABP1DS28_9APHY
MLLPESAVSFFKNELLDQLLPLENNVRCSAASSRTSHGKTCILLALEPHTRLCRSFFVCPPWTLKARGLCSLHQYHLSTLAMIKNPSLGANLKVYRAIGLPDPAKVLAKSRALLLSAKRRARIPFPARFFRGPALRDHRSKGSVSTGRTKRHLRPKLQRPLKSFDATLFKTMAPDFAVTSIKDARLEIAGRLSQQPLWNVEHRFYAEPPLAVIPREMELVLDVPHLWAKPTHYLAVYHSRSSVPESIQHRLQLNLGYRREVDIIPIHAYYLAAYCANLPPIPPTYSRSQIDFLRGPGRGKGGLAGFRLPVIPLPVPVPYTLPIILQYFYTRNLKQFSCNILPSSLHLPVNGTDGPRDESLRQHATYTLKIPLKELEWSAFKTWGVYQNMFTLGVEDDAMWSMMDFIWDVYFLTWKMFKEREARRA